MYNHASQKNIRIKLEKLVGYFKELCSIEMYSERNWLAIDQVSKNNSVYNFYQKNKYKSHL